MTAELIVFGEDWGGHPSSTQHLIKYISQNRKTLWVNSIGLRRPQFSNRDIKRLCRKGKALFSKPNQSQQKKISHELVDIINPKAIPWPGNPIANLWNRTILAQQISQKVKDKNLTKPLIWTSLPTVVDIVDKIDHHALIYYCGDDFGALDGVDHSPVLECEKRLSQKADLILVSSFELKSKFPAHKTILIPHGVDYDLFNQKAPCPIECKNKKPIAGFYGSIAEWVDINLIAKTASLLPNWDFMLVGDVKTDISALHQLSNIHLIPPQPHHKLPGFLQNWKAALLPFKDNDQIRACNPLKLREYLASETPVASTDFPAVHDYESYVNIFNSPEELAQILTHIKPKKSQAESVSHESWKAKATQVNNLLYKWDQL